MKGKLPLNMYSALCMVTQGPNGYILTDSALFSRVTRNGTRGVPRLKDGDPGTSVGKMFAETFLQARSRFLRRSSARMFDTLYKKD